MDYTVRSAWERDSTISSGPTPVQQNMTAANGFAVAVKSKSMSFILFVGSKNRYNDED
jgi:hypothetical protein